MNRHILRVAASGMLIMLFSIVSATAHAQTDAFPPVEAPLVREGDLAIDLAEALEVVTTEDEVEAETLLADRGISPRNGWIADYPVTPDILGELQKAVSDAALQGKVSMTEEEALARFRSVVEECGLSIGPYVRGDAGPPESGTAEYGPDSTVINNYYSTEGPPVVTYYAPPPAYVSLYSWVAYPFWWFGVSFSGFYVMNDFHRVVISDGHHHHHHPGKDVYISNHFHDYKRGKVFRINPRERFRWGTYYYGSRADSRYHRIQAGPGMPKRDVKYPPGTSVVKSGKTMTRKHRTVTSDRKLTGGTGKGNQRMTSSRFGKPAAPSRPERFEAPAPRETQGVNTPVSGETPLPSSAKRGTAAQPSRQGSGEATVYGKGSQRPSHSGFGASPSRPPGRSEGRISGGGSRGSSGAGAGNGHGGQGHGGRGR